jgi:glucose/arabinose dehydrogenase
MAQAHRTCLLSLVVATSCALSHAEALFAKPPDPMLAKTSAPWVTLSLDAPITGFRMPVQVVAANDGAKRMFVVEQHGLVKVVKDGKVDATPFLDASKLLGASGGEQGLLGLAFHPKFKENGRLFFAYTDKDEGNAFAEVRVVKGAVDMTTLRVLFSIEDFASNHNGGMLVFGPDGKLWIGTGDGGGGGDPQRTSQNDKSLLGKMLVVDVDAKNVAPAIAFKGLRNPWRYSFDRSTGDLWIADVGQNAWEFVFAVDKARLNEKLNFGWSVVEGAHCFRPKPGCDAKGFERVVFEYPHGEDGCSITGGYVYRGKQNPALVGSYVVGDYCSGRLWTIKRAATGVTVAKAADVRLQVSSFGEDEDGELWLVDHAGTIRKVLAK